MSSDNRVDPVQIVAHVGGVVEEISDSERAFEVWVHLAQKAGWNVTELVFASSESESRIIGSLNIEGIRYRVLYGPHVRKLMIDDTTEELLQKPVLAYAAWVEPDLETYELR